MEVIDLKVDNFIEAMILSIKCAGESNKENFDSVCLRIYEDSTFFIVDRCYSNSISSGRREGIHGKLDFYDLTVSKNTYPVADKPFRFLEFCVKYQIKLNN
jgi:hypothetical protein